MSGNNVELTLCDNAVVLIGTRFRFPDYSSLLADGFTAVELVILANGTETVLPASPNGTLSFTFPITPATHQLHLKVFKNGAFWENSGDVPFTVLPNMAVGGAGFSPPNDVHHISVRLNVPPPVANAFPAGSIYNGNTVGGIDAYIQYAPAHNGKLLKPLIFVDGIDFDETVYTFNGQVVRHGSTGWDIFTMGNEPSLPNPFDPDAGSPVYRNYPTVLTTLGAAPNDFDIVFVDFERGSDWIQKNGEALIALIQWVNAEKEKNRLSGLCPVDNVVVGASMGGQVARWALRVDGRECASDYGIEFWNDIFVEMQGCIVENQTNPFNLGLQQLYNPGNNLTPLNNDGYEGIRLEGVRVLRFQGGEVRNCNVGISNRAFVKTGKSVNTPLKLAQPFMAPLGLGLFSSKTFAPCNKNKQIIA